MKEITDIPRSTPAEGRLTVKLVDETDTDPNDNTEDGTKINGQNDLNSVVTSNKNFINKLVQVTSLGKNISLRYKTWLHLFSSKDYASLNHTHWLGKNCYVH